MKTKLVMFAITALFAASSLRAGIEPICVDVKTNLATVELAKLTELGVIDGGLQGAFSMRLSPTPVKQGRGYSRSVEIDFVAPQDPSLGDPIHLSLIGGAYDLGDRKISRSVKAEVSGVSGGGFAQAWGWLILDGVVYNGIAVYSASGMICFAY